MRFILTALIFLFGLFDLMMALNFLLNPATTAVGFGISPNGVQGLSTLRADFTAFFGVVAACMMIGAWRRNADLLLVPVQPYAAPTYEQLGALAADPVANQRLIQYTAPFDISGHPALTLPCRPTSAGLPVGVQLVARKGGERTLLAAGVALQRDTGWHKAHPAC